MRVDVNFKISNDNDNQYHDEIVAGLMDRYNWYDEYGLIGGDIPNMVNNDVCMSECYKMVLAVVQDVATKYHQILQLDVLYVSVNLVARNYTPGQTIQPGMMKEYKNITVKPMEQ